MISRRTRSRATTRLPAAIVVAALALGGCSSTDPDPSTAPTTGPPPAGSTTTGDEPSTDAPVDREALLADAHRRARAPGAVAVVVDADGRWAGASGTADLGGTPADPAMRFRIGSVTKPLVAALVLDAVGRGELGLDDDVARWVPDALDPTRPPVSVRMLLDHTSGIFNVGDEGDPLADLAALSDPALRSEAADLTARYTAGEAVVLPDRLWVAAAEVHPRYAAPGEVHHYSNTNYQLAAMVLERATGLDLAALVEQRLANPLGLRSMTLAPADRATPDLHGHQIAAGAEPVDITDDFTAFGNGGAGGIVTTADELTAALRAIVVGDLLTPELTAAMQQASPASEAADAPYGLGLARYELSCGTFLGHGGSVNGTQTVAMVDLAGERSVVAAINGRGPVDPRLTELADALVCGNG